MTSKKQSENLNSKEKKSEEKHPIHIQRKIVGIALMDKDFVEKYRNCFKPEYFQNPIHQIIIELQMKNFDAHNELINMKELNHALVNWVKKSVRKESDIKGEMEEVGKELKEIEKTIFDPTGSFAYCSFELVKFAQDQSMRNALLKSAKIMQKKPKDWRDKVLQLIENASEVGKFNLRIGQSVKDILEDESIKRDIFVDSWAERNALTMFAGREKIGKSILAINMMISLAKGKDFLGFNIPEPHRVLYVQQEIRPEYMKDRLEKIVKDPDDELLKENFHTFTTTGDIIKILNLDKRIELYREIRKFKPDLIVFDPLKTFHDFSDNDDAGMSKVLDQFYRIIYDFDVGIILIHHHGKPSKDIERTRGQVIRGSSVLSDRPDMLINMYSVEDRYRRFEEIPLEQPKENYAMVEFDLRSGMNPLDIGIVRDKDTLCYGISDILKEITEEISAEEIRRMISEHGGDGMPVKMLIERLTTNKIASRRTIYKYINKGEKEKLFRKESIPGSKGAKKLVLESQWAALKKN